MLFCQLGRADSLREICNGLGCCLGRLVHVGITRAPCRSTLSYANEHRPAALFEDLFFTALARFREQQGLMRFSMSSFHVPRLLSAPKAAMVVTLERGTLW